MQFDRAIQIEWNRCKRLFQPVSLLMIDVDFFKAFNDFYGHQAGDGCLRMIAAALSGCAKRASDTVARYGGEEFAVILPDTNQQGALTLAEKIRKGVEQLAIPHSCSPVSGHVTVSIGVNTVVPSGGAEAAVLIKSADKALYEAKKSRNQTVAAGDIPKVPEAK